MKQSITPETQKMIAELVRPVVASAAAAGVVAAAVAVISKLVVTNV